MRLQYALLMLIVMSSAVALAQESPDGINGPDQEMIELALGSLEEVKEQYNLNVDKVPGIVKKLFGNERLNIHITREDSTEITLGIAAEKAFITDIKQGGITGPTLNLYVDESTIIKIAESGNPPKALINAIDNKEITYEAVTLGGKLKFGAMGIIAKIVGFVKGLFT